MARKIEEIVAFRDDRLFDGAVNIDWFQENSEKARLASSAYVFHGAEYHGVNQDDIGFEHGHKLIDTASFTETVLKRSYGKEKQPFTLAIAGYGTGKSHLGLTLANLLSTVASDDNRELLNALSQADEEVANNVKLLQYDKKPCLVVALNGMGEFNLTAEVSRQIRKSLLRNGHEVDYLDDLRPRFQQAKSLLSLSQDIVQQEVVQLAGCTSIEEVFSALDEQDEFVYNALYSYFNDRGMPITVLAGESLKDTLGSTVERYCGDGKPYQSLVILFDEFGKYTEFATVRSQISGSGALQDLFEAVQQNEDHVCFIGFIQFDLNSYTKRVAPEYRNEILRYITRYQSADKLYLSVNLETLIANLLEKKEKEWLLDYFSTSEFERKTQLDFQRINKWFPDSQNFRSWTDSARFENIVARGCWPLSPYATWLLYYLAAAGKHLQERSALALLSEAYSKFANRSLEADKTWAIAPVQLLSQSLVQELLGAEELGQQGAIAHAYVTVLDKHATRLSVQERNVLAAILLASKLRIVAEDKDDAIAGLAALMGETVAEVKGSIDALHLEYNVIEWDSNFNSFDILGDAVPRTQFLSFLRQKVAEKYDQEKIIGLFTTNIRSWTTGLIKELECDFADEKGLRTKEWTFQPAVLGANELLSSIQQFLDSWIKNIDISDPRGRIYYCYIEPSRNIEEVEKLIQLASINYKKKYNLDALPFLVVFLHDVENKLGHALAEKAVLEKDFPEKAKFSNLVPIHIDKLDKTIQSEVEKLIKAKKLIIPFDNKEGQKRLSRIGSALFASIYPQIIPFPFDGFSSSKGDAAKTCMDLMISLFHGTIDLQSIETKGPKFKNRVLPVLRNSWGVFNKDGSLSSRPSLPVLRDFAESLDKDLKESKTIVLGDIIKNLCRPPYGANLASAGLFVACFIAARYKNLIFSQDGISSAPASWINEANIFKSNLLNPSKLNVSLVYTTDSGDEWKTFLDEWEACTLLKDKVMFASKFDKLAQKKVPPSELIYRIEALKDDSAKAAGEIVDFERKREQCLDYEDRGLRDESAGKLARSADGLKKLIDKMCRNEGAWPIGEIQAVEEDYGRIRQQVITFFDGWLHGQQPRSLKPDDVGSFKHAMLNVKRRNFIAIDLKEEAEKIEKYTLDKIRKVEEDAELQHKILALIRWLHETQKQVLSAPVLKLRDLKKQAKVHLEELEQFDVSKNTQLRKAQKQLLEILEEIDSNRKKFEDRAGDLWNSEIKEIRDIDRHREEIDMLITAFQGLDADLEDLVIMKDALNCFQEGPRKLRDINLTWDQFSDCRKKWLDKCEEKLGEEEIPWDYEEIIDIFSAEFEEKRKQESTGWVTQLSEKISGLASLATNVCQQLLTQVKNPPAYLAIEHEAKVKEYELLIVNHLSSKKIDWLMAEYQGLDSQGQDEFKKRIASLES